MQTTGSTLPVRGVRKSSLERQPDDPPSAPASTSEASSSLELASPSQTSYPPRLSIVVMPFANIGGDQEQDYFVDGVTESLTTDLSRIPGIFVIGRNTAFTYKGKAIDARQVGRELGVRYVMQGSIQSVGARVRINAQLIEADTGMHLWAERFDKPRADLFAMQDEVIARLARMVDIELTAAESRRAARERPNDLDSIDLTMRGMAIWNQRLTLETTRAARRLFEAALRLDERNVPALLGFANAHLWEVNTYVSDARAEQIQAADAAISRALVLAPSSARARFSRGLLLYAMRRPAQALHEFECAIGVDGNLALAHAHAGLMKFLLGRSKETRGHVDEAMRLSPRDPLLFHWHFIVGISDLYLGRVVRAVNSLRKSVELNPSWSLSYFAYAGALALAGLHAEAADACAAARRLAPNFSVSKFRAQAVSDNPVYLAQRARLYEGLRKAGVPETVPEAAPAETAALAPAPSTRPAQVALSYPEFVAALKGALRDFSRPDLLARNALLGSRLLAGRGNVGPGDLQALLSTTVDELFASPRDEKLRRVIELTYFRPAPKQEAAADRLGLAFGTYRRHLTSALGRLAEWLWNREQGTPA
jgi:TolB-like protein